MAKIIEFPDKDSMSVDPKVVLEVALRRELSDVIVIGYTEDGSFYLSASPDYKPDLMYMVELAKIAILESGEDDE